MLVRSEKTSLLHEAERTRSSNSRLHSRQWRLKYTVASLFVVLIVLICYSTLDPGLRAKPDESITCLGQKGIEPQLRPDITEKNVKQLFKSDEFKALSVKRLSGAVQIPTENFEEMGPIGEDKRWYVFYDLQQYFEQTFPLVHEKLEVEIVNVHGLVYTWRGSDHSLKPIFLTGHQDVVPVADDTRSQWKYPPFSGHFDGQYINGRGSHDCKNNVVAILSSIEALLEAEFTPSRTVVVAFGYDEEGSKEEGAYQIGPHLEKIWGENSFAILVDEGVMGVNHLYGRTIASPQASEKGFMNAVLRVHVPGGHSSMAPPHTSIGIASEAITALEAQAKQNFPSKLSSGNPFYHLLHCAAADPNTDLPKPLRKALKDPNGNKRVVELLADDFGSDILLRTSQAVTIFKAGNKVSALPQFAEAVINYRVSNEQTLDDVRHALTRTVRPIAEKHDLQFISRLEDDNSTSFLPEHALSLSWETNLVPSPVSSVKSDAWRYFVGTIKHVFDEPGEGGDVLVAPTIAQGNTDTRFYWRLSEQIYRFGPVRSWREEGWGGIHDVNEKISLEAHLDSILFFHEFIRVFNEAELAS